MHPGLVQEKPNCDRERDTRHFEHVRSETLGASHEGKLGSQRQNGMLLPEDRRKCKYDPFLVHVCYNGPLGTRLLGVQALGEYHAFVDDCVSCRCIIIYYSSIS